MMRCFFLLLMISLSHTILCGQSISIEHLAKKLEIDVIELNLPDDLYDDYKKMVVDFKAYVKRLGERDNGASEEGAKSMYGKINEWLEDKKGAGKLDTDHYNGKSFKEALAIRSRKKKGLWNSEKKILAAYYATLDPRQRRTRLFRGETFEKDPLSEITSKKILQLIRLDRYLLLRKEVEWRYLTPKLRDLLELEMIMDEVEMELDSLNKAILSLKPTNKELDVWKRFGRPNLKQEDEAKIEVMEEEVKERQAEFTLYKKEYDEKATRLGIEDRVLLGELRRQFRHSCFEEIPEALAKLKE